MSDLLNIALSGLTTAQRGMSVAGHNIANVNTPGYSRQVVSQSTRESFGTGAGFMGSGVQVDTIRRAFDEMLQVQLRGTFSEHARMQSFSDLALRLDGMNADASTGVSGAIERFFNAVQGVSTSPTDTTTRELLLHEAQSLVGSVQQLNSRMEALDREVNSRIEVTIGQINSLAQSLADVNDRISYSTNAFGQPPNDLLDRRDALLTDLSKLVNVSSFEQEDARINVFIGQGQPLVLGSTANLLAVGNDPHEPGRVEITFNGPGGQSSITGLISGGAIGGLLDVRRDLIDPARLSLGRTVTGIVSAVNEQHALGMDLRGDIGGLFFDALAPEVLRGTNNTGAATVALDIADWNALASSDFVMRFDGATWSLSRFGSNAAVPMTGTGTLGDPFLAEGMSFVVTGAANAGDTFRLSPVGDAARQFGVALVDAGAIAAAAPIRVSAGLDNAAGSTAAVRAIDTTNPALQNAVTVEFLTPTSYSLNGGPAIAWAQGDDIDVNGWRLEIAGAPSAGDVFAISSNVGAVGDNRNALAMDDLRNQKFLDGSTTTLGGSFNNTVSRTAMLTQQATTARDTLGVLADQTQGERERISGVNLDEEAARLVQLQQAYQASAQVISIAALMFDSLLAATGRR